MVGRRLSALDLWSGWICFLEDQEDEEDMSEEEQERISLDELKRRTEEHMKNEVGLMWFITKLTEQEAEDYHKWFKSSEYVKGIDSIQRMESAAGTLEQAEEASPQMPKMAWTAICVLHHALKYRQEPAWGEMVQDKRAKDGFLAAYETLKRVGIEIEAMDELREDYEYFRAL